MCSLVNCISSLEKCLQIFACILDICYSFVFILSFVILSLLFLIKYMNCFYTHSVGCDFILQHLIFIFENNVAGHRILGLLFFIFSALNIILLLATLNIVISDDVTIDIIDISLYVMSQFPLMALGF